MASGAPRGGGGGSDVEPIAADRRRLSLSHCDPIGGPRRRSAHGSQDKDRYAELRKVPLFELIKEEVAGKRAISITSVTDKDLRRRSSFKDKDEEILVPPGANAAELKAWVQSLGVGWVCRKGLKPEAPNQDSFSILIVEDTFALYGVYDGHGPSGHDVSDLVRDLLVKLFLAHPLRKDKPDEAFKDAFIECQAMIEMASESMAASSGTTCTMTFHNIPEDTVTVAHVADSRCIHGVRKEGGRPVYTARDLTIDHKPNLDKERQRIENAKPPGRVVFDGFYNYRVFAKAGDYPGLNMSRALGDIVAHRQAGLTAEPDVATLSLRDATGSNQMLLMCSDGVWEFIESLEAIDILASIGQFGSQEQARAGMAKLAKESWDRWMKDSDNDVADDITGICVPLRSRA